MNFVRSYGLLVGGAAALVMAFLLALLFPPPPSSGWTAYAPLSNFTSAPIDHSGLTIVSLLLALSGVVLITADIAFRMGRARRDATPAPAAPTK